MAKSKIKIKFKKLKDNSVKVNTKIENISSEQMLHAILELSDTFISKHDNEEAARNLLSTMIAMDISNSIKGK